MYLIPAFHKQPPYLRFLGNPKVSEMAAFIKKHADIKLTQVDVDQMAQMEMFQETQLKQMVEEEQRKRQMQAIEDELRRRGEL